jgi:hypothetical protein
VHLPTACRSDSGFDYDLEDIFPSSDEADGGMTEISNKVDDKSQQPACEVRALPCSAERAGPYSTVLTWQAVHGTQCSAMQYNEVLHYKQRLCVLKRLYTASAVAAAAGRG